MNDHRPLPSGRQSLRKSLVAIGLALCLASPSVLANDASRLQADIASTRARITQLESGLSARQSEIDRLRHSLRAERDENYRSLHSARREVTRQTFEVQRLEQSLALIDQQIALIRTDSRRSIERFESMNALKRSLESGEHSTRLQENAQRIGVLERDKQPLHTQLKQARSTLESLQLSLPNDALRDAPLDDQPAIRQLLDANDQDHRQIQQLQGHLRVQNTLLAATEERQRAERRRQQAAVAKARPEPKALSLPLVFEEAPSAGIAPGKKPWVFVISGDQVTDIESVLRLKPWVESYGGTYVEARWNGFSQSDRPDTQQFRHEFTERLRTIPPSARLILIGHGRGGGSAIEAATEVAQSLGRTIHLLAVLDPTGDRDLRANIVYRDTTCEAPDDDAGLKAYTECTWVASPRTITANVQHFYNRWQKGGGGMADNAPLLPVSLGDDDVEWVPSATGRFAVESGITADQKRVFYPHDQQAHLTLLREEARNLPNLLVKYMR